MSQEPCDPADSLEGAVSKLVFGPTRLERSSTATRPQTEAAARRHISPSGKINWDKVRVFEAAEYRTPWKLAMYLPGKRSKVSGEPELWLQVAIESGLVEMGSLEKGYQGGELLNPIDRRRGRPGMKRKELEALIARGIIDTLEKP